SADVAYRRSPPSQVPNDSSGQARLLSERNSQNYEALAFLVGFLRYLREYRSYDGPCLEAEIRLVHHQAEEAAVLHHSVQERTGRVHCRSQQQLAVVKLEARLVHAVVLAIGLEHAAHVVIDERQDDHVGFYDVLVLPVCEVHLINAPTGYRDVEDLVRTT